MFFGWWRKKKEPLNCKSVLILTNLREDEVAYLSQHPDDRNIISQIISPLAIIDNDKQINSAKMSFWRDGEMFKNLKPGTVYKVYYRNFEAPDSRVNYPNSYYLERMEEYKENDSYVKALVKEAVRQEEEAKKAREERLEDNRIRREQLTKELERIRKERTFDYKGTTFDVDVADGVGLDVNEDDEYEGEKTLVKAFADNKDEIIGKAIKKAVEELLDNAKDWTDNQNLTEQEFIDNLLARPFTVHIEAEDSYEIWFWTNEMFTDHNLVCYIDDGVCRSVGIEG